MISLEQLLAVTDADRRHFDRPTNKVPQTISGKVWFGARYNFLRCGDGVEGRALQ